MPAAPRGLPGALPPGERLLWQGAPDWRVLATRVFHVRKIALYFAILLVWYLASSLQGEEATLAVLLGTARLAGVALIPVGVVLVYAWLTARTTVYSITSRRVVIHGGVAMPLSINIPFARIASADLRVEAGGTGDISLALTAKDHLAYFMLWPHARPWRMARPQPTFRAIRDAQATAEILSRAVAAAGLVATAAQPGSAAPEKASMPAGHPAMAA